MRISIVTSIISHLRFIQLEARVHLIIKSFTSILFKSPSRNAYVLPLQRRAPSSKDDMQISLVTDKKKICVTDKEFANSAS